MSDDRAYRECKAEGCDAMLTFAQSLDTERWLPLQLLEEVPEDQRKRAKLRFAINDAGMAVRVDLACFGMDIYVSHYQTCPGASQFGKHRGPGRRPALR